MDIWSRDVEQVLLDELRELSEVTPAMLDAGSAIAYDISVERMQDGKTRAHPVTEAAYLTAIWRAMLRVKLLSLPG